MYAEVFRDLAYGQSAVQMAEDIILCLADKVFSGRMAYLGGYCADEAARKSVTLESALVLSEEACELSIGAEGIRVCAAGEKGYVYALVTLYQLLAHNDGCVPVGTISDSPGWRGGV